MDKQMENEMETVIIWRIILSGVPEVFVAMGIS